MSTQRRRKRRRKRLRASPPLASSGARNSYFDAVPNHVLRIVLSYLSRRSQHHNWHAYVSAHSVNAVLDIGGALARAAVSEFHSLGGKDSLPLSNDDDDVSIVRPLVYRLPLRRLVLKVSREGAVADLIRGCGAELRELEVDAGCHLINQVDVYAISTSCTKLSYLAIRSHFVTALSHI